jgi:hypothetical protein
MKPLHTAQEESELRELARKQGMKNAIIRKHRKDANAALGQFPLRNIHMNTVRLSRNEEKKLSNQYIMQSMKELEQKSRQNNTVQTRQNNTVQTRQNNTVQTRQNNTVQTRQNNTATQKLQESNKRKTEAVIKRSMIDSFQSMTPNNMEEYSRAVSAMRNPYSTKRVEYLTVGGAKKTHKKTKKSRK